MPRKALITGVTGQDGSYLAELLLEKGYEVSGLVRPASSSNLGRLERIYRNQHDRHPRFQILHGDLGDSAGLCSVVQEAAPDEVYNLAAQSHVRTSFDMPEYTYSVSGVGTLRLLEALRQTRSTARFYQASTSELYGKVQEIPQNEGTPFYPRSPYGVAKLLAYWTTVNYRESYGMFACNGILFNHESPRRGENFVSRKIARAAAKIKCGLQHELFLGNLDAQRDWGYAPEYVEAMWLMLQQDQPEDFVIATGKTHSVRDFLTESFGYLGLEWQQYVKVDERYYRPAEVDLLVGDPRKAQEKLAWKSKVDFKALVRIMVDGEMENIKSDPLTAIATT